METLTPNLWLQKISLELQPVDYEIVRQAVLLAQFTSEKDSTPTHQSSLTRGLMAAEVLHKLHLDGATLAAAILYHSVQSSELTNEDIKEHLGAKVAKLVRGTQQMASVSGFYQGLLNSSNYLHNIANIRKMLLAMVDDIRVVLIKLAEQLCILRNANALPQPLKKQLATETMAIYAPLTNRLGIAQLKWELEDLAFNYLEPEKYQEIAATLKHRFPACDQYIQEIITLLQTTLAATQINNLQITGRIKHIYSIYRKMQRKKVGIDGIYDVSAIRIFVPTITDCYTALSHVHATWQYIPDEFDDYIASPKPNGYRSIHTAVYGPKNRVIEIQIRTHEMHHEAELGIAAHWVYKEGKQETIYQAKLSWLRQVMDWQQEVTKSEKNFVDLQQIFNDHVYIFTPQGDVLELPQGATPIDFAYHLHSELGHRCCGAKINNTIVPLTYILKTGDHVGILTSKDGKPRRDWLNPNLGFIHTSRARAKVFHWFKKQSQEDNIIQGQELLNRELQRLNLPKLDLKTAADRLHFKTAIDLLAALGNGDLKFSGILNALNVALEKTQPETAPEIIQPKTSKEHYTSDINIQGVSNLLTYTANCCRPLPGEKIIGYITQGKGVAIHRIDCINALHLQKLHAERFIMVAWSEKTEKKYPVCIVINAFSRPGLVRDITNILADEGLMVLGLELTTDKQNYVTKIKMTIEISGLRPLSQILTKISGISNIIEVYRND